jgi:hypothetical protein
LRGKLLTTNNNNTALHRDLRFTLLQEFAVLLGAIKHIHNFIHSHRISSQQQSPREKMSTLSNAALRTTAKNASSKLLGSTRSMAGGKEIRFGVEGRAAMLRGVDLMADAVQVRYVYDLI